MTDRGATPYVLMALAVSCVSLGSILVRLAQAPPLAIAFQRVFLASAIVLPFAARDTARALPALPARRQLLLVLVPVLVSRGILPEYLADPVGRGWTTSWRRRPGTTVRSPRSA